MKDRYEMSGKDVLCDPLIRQMMEADGVSVEELSRLMADVSERIATQGQGKQTALGAKPLPCETGMVFPLSMQYRLVFRTWH